MPIKKTPFTVPRRNDKKLKKKAVPRISALSRQQKIIEQFGSFDFHPDYDYKAARRGR